MWIKNLNDAFKRGGLSFNDFAIFLETNTQILKRIISIKQMRIVIIIYYYFCIKNVF